MWGGGGGVLPFSGPSVGLCIPLETARFCNLSGMKHLNDLWSSPTEHRNYVLSFCRASLAEAENLEREIEQPNTPGTAHSYVFTCVQGLSGRGRESGTRNRAAQHTRHSLQTTSQNQGDCGQFIFSHFYYYFWYFYSARQELLATFYAQLFIFASNSFRIRLSLLELRKVP